MGCTHFAFAAAPFVQGAHPLEQKKVASERPVALLRFAPGFADPSWCVRAHAIYVLEGTLELELRDRVQRVAAGDGCWLDAGTAHRARNPGQTPVLAFLVSDLAVVPGAVPAGGNEAAP
jgi:quercetin dioxygenase-like cupin family protein